MNRFKKIILLSIGHLLIDLEGIYLINVQYNNYDFKDIALFFIIYNLIAFGLQPILGYYADIRNKYLQYAILGSLFPIAALFFKDIGLVAIIISTIGNAMYHVGGGVLAMNLYPSKAAPAGVFVAPGAIGVFLGVLLAADSHYYTPIIALIGILVVISIWLLFRGSTIKIEYKKINQNFIVIIILILIIVFIRGFIGSILMFTWKDELLYEILLVAGIFIGKFLGGLLGDRYGLKKTGIFGLLVSGPLLLFGYYIPIAGLLGALFFNLTMAITLFIIMDNLGKYKGFAFGLTTLSLVIAFLPKLLGFSLPIGVKYYAIILLLVVLGSYLVHKVVILYDINNSREEGC